MIDISAVFANLTGTFPNFAGKNTSGAGSTDGTEWLAAFVDNWGWGWQQALFDYMGITPDGVTEATGASQILDALNMFLPIGCPIEWNRANDPATDGLRFLLLNGQGILRANYTDLDAAVYVGDANNAAVAAAGGAYYHADDSAGTTPNTAGAYLILPESRGYTVRGLDSAASVDPDGASRALGDNQLDSMQGHLHSASLFRDSSSGPNSGILNTTFGATISGSIFIGISAPITDGTNGTPRTASETRGANRSTQWAVRY